jgi:flavodoxin
MMNKIAEHGRLLKPIVLYASKSGNTEKIAREIASELKCRCEKISENSDSTSIDLNDFDLVFLGAGNYDAKPNAEILNYLKEMNLNNKLNFALFMTWLGRGTTDKGVYNEVKAAVEEKGQRLMENYYSCFFEGHSIIARVITRLVFRKAKGHPTAEDLSNARKWAKEIVRSINDF